MKQNATNAISTRMAAEVMNGCVSGSGHLNKKLQEHNEKEKLLNGKTSKHKNGYVKETQASNGADVSIFCFTFL